MSYFRQLGEILLAVAPEPEPTPVAPTEVTEPVAPVQPETVKNAAATPYAVDCRLPPKPCPLSARALREVLERLHLRETPEEKQPKRAGRNRVSHTPSCPRVSRNRSKPRGKKTSLQALRSHVQEGALKVIPSLSTEFITAEVRVVPPPTLR